MSRRNKGKARTEEPTISPRDIFFECPACSKSLVVDETAEGMIVECPQCHINVIVPPKVSRPPAPPHEPPATRAEVPARPPEPVKTGGGDLVALQDRLGVLAGQLRELQTQWVEVTNRIASHINEVNRESVMVARHEASHKQIMREWNQIVAEIAAAGSTVAQPPPAMPPKA